MPLLLPREQGVLRAPRRVGRVAVVQEFVEQLVLDWAAVVGAEERVKSTEYCEYTYFKVRLMSYSSEDANEQ